MKIVKIIHNLAYFIKTKLPHQICDDLTTYRFWPMAYMWYDIEKGHILLTVTVYLQYFL